MAEGATKIMADIFGVYCRNTGADMEFVDKNSGLVVFAFRNAVNNQIVQSVVDNITAKAGGGQATAVLMTAAMNRITIVATGNDSVKLPPSVAGLDVVIINAAASNAANVYPATGDQINVLGVNAAFSVAANKVATFYCCTAGQWHSILTA
jgi:hypothetical protein